MTPTVGLGASSKRQSGSKERAWTSGRQTGTRICTHLSFFKSGDLEGGAMIYLSEVGSQDPASKWTLTEG